MLRKLKHSLACILAICMVVTCLPLGLVVWADTPDIYYIYAEDEVSDPDIGTVVPQGMKKLGVFVRNGSYALQHDDLIAIADNATITLTDEQLSEAMSDPEGHHIAMSGTGKLVADSMTLTSDLAEYGNTVVSVENVKRYYFEEGPGSEGFNYEITSDLNVDFEFHARDFVIDPGVTVTLTSTDEREENNCGRLCVKNALINGTLAIEGMTEESPDMKELVIDPAGSLFVGSTGAINADDYAGIYLCNEATFEGIELWQVDGDDYILAKQGEEFQFIYYGSISKWVGAIDGMVAGKFYARFERFEQDDGGYEGVVLMGDEEINPFAYYDYKVGEKITLTLMPPSFYVEAGTSPLVDVHMASDPANCIAADVTEKDGHYEATYTPVDADGIYFDIYWSAFDTIHAGENEFEFMLFNYGSVDFDVQLNGTTADTDKVQRYVSPVADNCTKYIASRDLVGSDDVLSIVISGRDGHNIDSFSFDDRQFDAESVLDEHGFSAKDGVFTYTFDEENLKDYFEMHVTADDGGPGGEGPYFESNKFVVDFDSWTDDRDGEQIVQGHVLVGDTELAPWEPMDYEAGDNIEFTLIPPENRSDVTPVVEIELPDDEPVIPVVEAVSGKEGEYSFTYTPESGDGFTVRIWWSDFDRFGPTEKEFMIETDCDDNNGSITVSPDLDHSSTDPSAPGHRKGVYDEDNVPDVANVTVTPSQDCFVREIEIEYADQRYRCVPDGMEKQEDWQYFSECDWINGNSEGATITVPTDIGDNWVRIRVNFDREGGQDQPGGWPADGRYRIEFDDIPFFDEDTQELIHLAHVMIGGDEINPGYEGDIDTNNPIPVTISLPEDRMSCEHVVVIETPDDVSEYTVTGNSIPVTLTSTEGTVIWLHWSRYDMFQPDDQHVIVITESEGNGSLDVTCIADYEKVANPSNPNEIKNVAARDSVDAGDVVVTFIPEANNRLIKVDIEEDYDNGTVTFVPEADERFPDATLMSEDDRFAVVDGNWTFTVAVPDDDLGHQVRVKANFESAYEGPGEININPGEYGVQYAFVKDGVTGDYSDLNGSIVIDPADDPDQVILKFSADRQLYALRISHEFNGGHVNEVRKFDANNTVTLNKEDGWGLYTIDLADEGMVTNNEYRIRVFGSEDYHPLVDLKEDTIYEYDIDSTITLDLGDSEPYKVIARSNFADEVEVTRNSSGKYEFKPLNTAGFEIVIFETAADLEFESFVPEMNENCFEFRTVYVDYAEGEVPQTNVSFTANKDDFRFLTSSDGSRTKVCVSKNLAEFGFSLNRGSEIRGFEVILNGGDITQAVADAGGFTLTAAQIEQLNGLEFKFYHKKTYSITAAQVTGGSLTVAASAEEGSTVTITPVPELGYELDNIVLKGSETGNTLTLQGSSFTMPNENVTLTATFKKINYTINSAQTVNGTVTVPATANYGDEVTITIVPDEGYAIDTLSVKDASENAIEVTNGKFTMPASSVTVTATFKACTYTVGVEEATGGTVSVDKTTANYGDIITVTVNADPGYAVDKVLLDGNEITTNTFAMPAKNVTVSAVFTAIDYEVILAATTNGTAEVSKTTANVGDKITVTTHPATGYVVDEIKVNDQKIQGNEFTMGAANANVSVTFKMAEYDVNVAETAGGTVTVSKSKANMGDEITITATPAAGYELDSISVVDADEVRIAVTNGKFTMPAADVTVTASFKEIPKVYSLSVVIDPEGSATVDGIADTAAAHKGDTYEFTVAVAEGYELVSVKANNTILEAGNDGSYMLVQPDGDVVLKITCEQIKPEEGWKTDEEGNKYYYKDGEPVKGWLTLDGKKYYFNSKTDVMATGWKKFSSGNVYYFAKSTGASVKGLKELGEKYYFFDTKGIMKSGWKTIDGKKYYFKLNSTKTKAPAYVDCGKKIGSYYYLFNAKGVMQKSGVKSDSKGNSYYLKSDGKAYTKKWYKKSGKYYYFGSNGKMVKNTSLKIGKKTYKFDKKGVCKNP